MRDFNNGRDINVTGDFVVNDNSQQYKPLGQCSNEELLVEEPWRWQKLQDERKGKLNRLLGAVCIAATLLFVAGAWWWFQGKIDLFAFATGAAGFLIGLGSLNVYERPTDFEVRQLDALREIHTLLRERGAR